MTMPISHRLPTAPLRTPLTAPRSRSEPPLEADEEPDRLPVGYCLGEIDADPPGVGSPAEVGLPLVEGRDAVVRNSSRSITRKPGLARVAQENEVYLVNAEEPVQLTVVLVAVGVAESTRQGTPELRLGEDRPVTERRVRRIGRSCRRTGLSPKFVSWNQVESAQGES